MFHAKTISAHWTLCLPFFELISVFGCWNHHMLLGLWAISLQIDFFLFFLANLKQVQIKKFSNTSKRATWWCKSHMCSSSANVCADLYLLLQTQVHGKAHGVQDQLLRLEFFAKYKTAGSVNCPISNLSPCMITTDITWSFYNFLCPNQQPCLLMPAQRAGELAS